MAIRAAIGAITILDVTDGTSPITAFSTNENHTFIATEFGVVSSGDLAKFSSDLVVFIGNTQAPYATSGNNTYKLGTIVFSDGSTTWPLAETSVTVNSVLVRRITLTSASSGVTDLSVTATIPVIVTNSVGSTNTINVVLSLQKQIAGATGVIINMVPNKQTFLVDAEGLEIGTQADATVLLELTGTQGTISIQSSVNGGAFSTCAVATSNPIATGTVKELDIDGTGDNDKFVVSIENFLGTTSGGALGTSTNAVSYKVSSNGGGVDVITFSKTSNGKTGDGSILVSITSSTNGNTFQNNTGDKKTLIARIFDAGSGTGEEVSPHTSTNGAVTGGATSITVDSTGGFPATGTLIVGSDVFTYTSKTDTTFVGIPSSGANAVGTISDNVLISLNGSPRVRYFWYEAKDGNDALIHTVSNSDRNVVLTGGVNQTVFTNVLTAGGTEAFDRLIVGPEDVSYSKGFNCLVRVLDD